MASNGFDCLLIVANLCLHNVTSVEMHESSVMARALVRGQGFEANVILRSDNIRTPDWSKMNQACAEDVCVAYVKFCSHSGGEYSCSYHFSQPGEIQNTVVEIVAKDPRTMHEAESSFGVLSRSGWMPMEIPFAKFTVSVEGAAAPPYCRRRAGQTECWPNPK